MMAKSKNNCKAWLTIGVSVIILGVLFALFELMIVSKETVAGKHIL